MTTIKYYGVWDKSEWPEGPWHLEPDKVQWIDRNTDLDCLAVRGPLGHWCGYVGVGPDHPWYGLDYAQCFECGEHHCLGHTYAPKEILDAHRGVTFSQFCDERRPEASAICHVPQEGRPDPVWWFGFDCAHSADLEPLNLIRSFTHPRGDTKDDHQTYRTFEYVKQETRSLAQQMKGIQ
jgi:hypothetical protein